MGGVPFGCNRVLRGTLSHPCRTLCTAKKKVLHPKMTKVGFSGPTREQVSGEEGVLCRGPPGGGGTLYPSLSLISMGLHQVIRVSGVGVVEG